MKGISTSARLSTPITAITRMSALAEVENGLIWYQNVYSHSQLWPGKLPVSFIMPQVSPPRCSAAARLASCDPSARNIRLFV